MTDYILTPADIKDFREDINDDPVEPDKRMFTDERLQHFYTVAEKFEDDLPNTRALARVYAWEKIVAAMVPEVDYTMTLIREARNQAHDHAVGRLEYWRGEAGLGGGQLLVGMVDLGIDEDGSESETEWAS